jgi:uncharacterized membrane protein
VKALIKLGLIVVGYVVVTQLGFALHTGWVAFPACAVLGWEAKRFRNKYFE